MKTSVSLLKRLLDRIARLWRKPEPEDPYAYRTVPLRHPPSSRGAAAVAELDEE